VSGWISDIVPHRKAILAGGYALAGVTAIFLTTTPASLWLLGACLSWRYLCGTEEALEDSLAAELIPREQHGMAFGTLAAVNAVGDFLSRPGGWVSVVGRVRKSGVFFFRGFILPRSGADPSAAKSSSPRNDCGSASASRLEAWILRFTSARRYLRRFSGTIQERRVHAGRHGQLRQITEHKRSGWGEKEVVRTRARRTL